ncbi:MAG: HAMP domain-containing sensor histidine kinase [Bacteroidota bacterium]
MNYEGELLLRLLSIYAAQIGLALIFSINFFYFSRVYSRRFLSKWSISWIGLVMLSAGMMFVSWPGALNLSTGLKLSGTLVHTTGGFIQAAFLALGTYELVNNRYIERKISLLFAAGATLLAFVLVFIYAFDDDRYMERYVLRIGLRSFIIGLVYIVSGSLAIFSRRFGLESYGKKLLSIAFIAYGIAQMGYFVTVILVVYGVDVSIILSIYGIVDLFLVTIMGLGMVMWLLEDERLKLKDTNADLDRFLYSTSHDLRAPIASVLGLTHVAKLETDNSDTAHYFDKIEERVKKLDEVISDILFYSKNSKSPVKKDKINFNDLLDEVVTDLKFNKGAASIRLVFDRNKDHQTTSDASQLKIILNNLLANAVKYHDLEKTDPLIEVVFKKEFNKVFITIRDNGSGIEPEHLEKIFDMFYRATTSSDGSGLGLFIVKEAVKKIGGQITVNSEPGKGSTFVIEYQELSEAL